MIKEIVYNGFTCAQNDRDCQDGDLALALNVLPENKALVGIGSPTNIGLQIDGVTNVWLHNTTNYEHYIYAKTLKNDEEEYQVLYWAYKDGDGEWHKTEDEEREPILTLNPGEDILSVVFVGNTLVCSTSSQMYYYLCRYNEESSEDNYCRHSYIFLDNKVPDLEIQFALSNYVIQKNYPKTGITKEQIKDYGTRTGSKIDDDLLSEIISSGKVLGGAYFYTTKSESGDKIFSFSESVQLKPNRHYILYTNKSFTYRYDVDGSEVFSKITLYGSPSKDNDVYRQKLAEMTSPRWEFYNDNNEYYNLTFQISVTGDTADGTLFIAEAPEQTSPYLSASYWIQYTLDNYNAVMGCINKFVKEQALDKNRFVHPFFIRYALRLYDSTLCKLSPPILMTPNTAYVPFVHTNNEWDKSETGQDLNLYAFCADLQYKLLNSIDDQWKDIIQSVEIYVSSPIYPYTQEESLNTNESTFSYRSYVRSGENIESQDLIDFSYGFGCLKDAVGNIISNDYTVNDLTAILYQQFGFANDFTRIILASAKDEDKIDEEIKEVSTFYHIKTINLEDLPEANGDFEDIVLKNGVLSSLEGRETLQDQEVTYDSIIGGKLFSYNNRLHVYGGSAVYRGIAQQCIQMQYINSTEPKLFDDGYVNVGDRSTNNRPYPQRYKEHTAYVYIRTNEGTVIVSSLMNKFIGSGPGWFFYPDNRAYQLVLLDYSLQNTATLIPLSEHPFLNGAFFYSRSVHNTLYGNWPQTSIPTQEELNNKIQSSSIFVSEVDNPFTFLNKTAVSTGSGNVLAMSTAAQAMSQGQFGQFPVYAFTDEGVWALEVASDGTYSSSQPISRDVCINANGVTSIDSSVVFPTSRGIMEASGSRVECISKDLDGRSYFDITQLPHYKDILDKVGLDATIYNFKKFLSTCHCLYDYTNQRIFFYSPGNNMAYVLSLKDAAWGMAVVNIATEINSYPNALAIDSDGNVIDFSSIDEDEKIPYLAITRPLKLEETDTLKSIFNVIQRGYFRKGHLSQFLWGSRNLYDWESLGDSDDHKLTRLRGSGYKYLRIGIVGNLFIDESISGATIEMEDRLNNKVR